MMKIIDNVALDFYSVKSAFSGNFMKVTAESLFKSNHTEESLIFANPGAI